MSRAIFSILALAFACGPSAANLAPEYAPDPSFGESPLAVAPEPSSPASVGEETVVNACSDGEPPITGARAAELLGEEDVAVVPRCRAASPSLAEALAACPPARGDGEESELDFYDACQLPSTMAFAAGVGWVILDVDHGEGGPEAFILRTVPVSELGELGPSREIMRAGLSPESVDALRHAIEEFETATPADNLVIDGATLGFSLGEYVPLAGLRAPLGDQALMIRPNEDLDDPEWTLTMTGRESSPQVVVATHVADLGACDGGGYWCEETQAECDDAGLRAEGRLCILPVHIDTVAHARGTLAIQGIVVVAGHGGYPPFSWVVRLPEELRPEP